MLPASSPSAPSPLLFDNNNNNDNDDDDEDSRGETPVIGGGAASNEVEYRFSQSRTNYTSDIERDFNRAFGHGRDNGGEKLKENYDYYGKWNNELCYESNWVVFPIDLFLCLSVCSVCATKFGQIWPKKV